MLFYSGTVKTLNNFILHMCPIAYTKGFSLREPLAIYVRASLQELGDPDTRGSLPNLMGKMTKHDKPGPSSIIIDLIKLGHE